MSWIIAVAALVGTTANIYKKRWCFGVWILTNSYWVVYDYSIGAIAQSALFFVYFLLAVWGLVRWR